MVGTLVVVNGPIFCCLCLSFMFLLFLLFLSFLFFLFFFFAVGGDVVE